MTTLTADVRWALTLHQPYAQAVVCLGKPIENRPWPCPARHLGDLIAIHAGQTFNRRAEAPPGMNWPAGLLPRQAVVGVARITGCHPSPDLVSGCGTQETLCNPWAIPGCFHWELADIQVLSEPVPVPGQRRFWPLPDWPRAAIREQLSAGQLLAR